MFDLFRSRAKAVRIMLGGLLTIVALSMLLYLIPGFSGMGGAGGADSQIIAQVGKDTITVHQVQLQIQGLVKNRQIPAQLLSVYVPQIIDQMVTERALAYEAKRLGLAVSDAELADTIRSIGQGRFADSTTYKMFVEQQGFSVPEFESSLRDSLLMTRLEAVATKSIVVTPDEVQADFARQNDKIKVSYLLFSEENLKSKINATDADLKTYYDQHRNTYRLPERRDAAVLVVDDVKVTGALQLTDAQLRAAYSANLESFRTPERVKVRHILLTTTGKSKDEVAAIRKKADALLGQLKSGADFADLAKKNSQDPGSGANGGDLGWIVRGQTVKNFEAAAFALKPNQLSDIITTEYGFHIIQVEEHQDARVKPFDEVKGELADTQKKQMASTRMQQLADQAQAELRKTPQQAAQVAAKLGLELVTAHNLGASDPVPGLVSPELSTAIAGLTRDGVGAPVPVGTAKLAIPVCTAVIPARPAEYADVVNQVRTQYTTAAVAKLAADMAAKAAVELKSGKDINEVAKSLGVDVKTPEPFTVVGAVEGFGPAISLGDAFSKRAGDVVGPFNLSNKTLVGRIVEKIPASQAQLASQREGIVNQLKNKKIQEAQALFEDSVRTRLTQERKITINKEVVNRVAAGYTQS